MGLPEVDRKRLSGGRLDGREEGTEEALVIRADQERFGPSPDGVAKSAGHNPAVRVESQLRRIGQNPLNPFGVRGGQSGPKFSLKDDLGGGSEALRKRSAMAGEKAKKRRPSFENQAAIIGIRRLSRRQDPP